MSAINRTIRSDFNFFVKVSTDIDDQASWKECFVLRNVKLPTGYFFGFSAATGELSGYFITLICFRG